MIGLDTSAIIDLFKGKVEIKRFLESNTEPIAVTIMSYLELSFGLDPSKSKHTLEGNYYDEFFKSVYMLELKQNACKDSSKLFWKLKKEGSVIDQFDCVIAALFLRNGINKILTGNPKHFERIKGMKVLRY